MKRAVLLLLSIAIAGLAGATAQIPDQITIADKAYALYTNPLNVYLEANPGKLPESGSRSTALWRGYIATWSMREDRLYLDQVKIPTKHYWEQDAPGRKNMQLGDEAAVRQRRTARCHLVHRQSRRADG